MDLKLKCCGMTVKRLVMAAVSVTRKEALTVKTHTLQTTKVQRITLIGKGKWNLKCCRLCINYIKLTVKYLFICRHLLGGLSCTQINTFSFGKCVSLDGSSCIQVNIMYCSFTCTADAGYFQQNFQ